MAAVLESVTLPRSSNLSRTISLPIMASSISSLSSIRKGSSLREFKGLKLQVRSKERRFVRRGGTIVCEAQDTALEVSSVSEATWKSLVLESDSPTLVEFWAPWCGPCRMIHPVINELAKQYTGKLKCFKLNTDESPSIATQYGIRSIPTVIIFKNGEKKDAVIGAVPKSTLTTSIEKFL